MPKRRSWTIPKLKEEGKKWIRHFGCAGCHEISGFEEEGRIGTELTFEGSKPIERLDFALLTEAAQRGGSEPIVDAEDRGRLPEGPARKAWYDDKGFFTFKKAGGSVKKYNCMGCHQLIPSQKTALMGMARYQGPDGQEQLPPNS